MMLRLCVFVGSLFFYFTLLWFIEYKGFLKGSLHWLLTLSFHMILKDVDISFSHFSTSLVPFLIISRALAGVNFQNLTV